MLQQWEPSTNGEHEFTFRTNPSDGPLVVFRLLRCNVLAVHDVYLKASPTGRVDDICAICSPVIALATHARKEPRSF